MSVVCHPAYGTLLQKATLGKTRGEMPPGCFAPPTGNLSHCTVPAVCLSHTSGRKPPEVRGCTLEEVTVPAGDEVEGKCTDIWRR